MRFARSTILAAGLALPCTAGGQVVVGTVREVGSRTPIADAEVVLSATVAGRPLSRSLTDSAGAFRAGLSGTGSYTVRVEHVGYVTFVSQPFTVAGGETVALEIRLGRNAIPLDPLIVTARTTDSRLAGFHERRHTRFFGRYLTREDIDSRPATRTTDLLRSVPGVTLQRVRARNRGERSLLMVRGPAGNCEPAIYIDGVRTQQSADASIDDVLVPDMIEGVEVYTSSAGAPVQYVQPGTCGLVLFWTRQGEATGPRLNLKRVLIGAGFLAAILLLFR